MERINPRDVKFGLELAEQKANSGCRHFMEGVVILDYSGKRVVSAASRMLVSSNGMRLCGAECRWGSYGHLRCPSKHAAEFAIRTAIEKRVKLGGLFLCRVMISDSITTISNEMCCRNCEKIIAENGLTILQSWDGSTMRGAYESHTGLPESRLFPLATTI